MTRASSSPGLATASTSSPLPPGMPSSVVTSDGSGTEVSQSSIAGWVPSSGITSRTLAATRPRETATCRASSPRRGSSSARSSRTLSWPGTLMPRRSSASSGPAVPEHRDVDDRGAVVGVDQLDHRGVAGAAADAGEPPLGGGCRAVRAPRGSSRRSGTRAGRAPGRPARRSRPGRRRPGTSLTPLPRSGTDCSLSPATTWTSPEADSVGTADVDRLRTRPSAAGQATVESVRGVSSGAWARSSSSGGRTSRSAPTVSGDEHGADQRRRVEAGTPRGGPPSGLGHDALLRLVGAQSTATTRIPRTWSTSRPVRSQESGPSTASGFCSGSDLPGAGARDPPRWPG